MYFKWFFKFRFICRFIGLKVCILKVCKLWKKMHPTVTARLGKRCKQTCSCESRSPSGRVCSECCSAGAQLRCVVQTVLDSWKSQAVELLGLGTCTAQVFFFWGLLPVLWAYCPFKNACGLNWKWLVYRFMRTVEY